MTVNVLNIFGEIIGIVVGGSILIVFAVFFSHYVVRPAVLPGQAGARATRGQDEEHQEEGEEKGGEVVRADGYIDSYGGVIEEAGGGLPLLVKITAVGILLWWIMYIIINWSQYLLSMRTFQF